MEEKVYDLITIGGGPSGLICSITAMTGVPIDPPGDFRCLVLDKDDIGEFAHFGRLRITHGWHFDGAQVIDYLKHEAAQSGIELKNREAAVAVSLQDGMKAVTTTKSRYLARKLAVCTGFYPYGSLMRYTQCLRVLFGPIEWEAAYLPQEKKYKIAVIGAGHTTMETAVKLKAIRPDLQISVIIDDASPSTEEQGMDVQYGRIAVKSARGKKIHFTVHRKDGTAAQLACRFVLINYNSYTHTTENTAFLAPLGLDRINGYLPVDGEGNTSIPGIVAAGNITTPVSGVLTALATGFTAGLNLYAQLYRERFGKLPKLFPWLPLDNPLEHVLMRNGRKP